MRIIAHRGNVDGPNPELENSPAHIDQAIQSGFDAEVDVWVMPGDASVWLGHDAPMYPVPWEFLTSRRHRLWCHAKNLRAMAALFDHDLNAFAHDFDDRVFTTHGFVWTFPGRCIIPGHRVVCVLPGADRRLDDEDMRQCHAICTDYCRRLVAGGPR